MKKVLFISFGLFCVMALAVSLYLDLPPADESFPDEKLALENVLGAQEPEGFARAFGPRAFVFPADHGPHPRFKTEWWYYTGNLLTETGRRFGYQLTFFRTALQPGPTQRTSNWATNQVYMAHFAVTDPENERFYDFERFSRDSIGLAGAKAEPFEVWLEDWKVEGTGDEDMPMRVSADAGDVGISLRLENVKPIVLQGENGLSRKSSQPGNASYYYSMTRLLTDGWVRVSDETFEVSGTSWLDREWSTSVLGEDQVGWDWFSLQLEDGRELMYYQLRLQDGTTDASSSGVLVRVDGSTRRLSSDDVRVRVLDHWQSPETGTKYPSGWSLEIVPEQISLELTPLLAGQELNTTVRYWEGAVSARGEQLDRNITGYGYVELTGY